MSIFCSLFFLLSFVTLKGMLNDNFYVKLLTFELFFLIATLYSIVKFKVVCSRNFSLIWSDYIALLFGGIYICHCIGTFNVIEHSLPILYILLYFLIRFIQKDNWVNTLVTLAPIVILIHLIICFLQYISFLPNYNNYFRVGSTFGNPDMLSAYLSMLLPFCFFGDKWKLFKKVIILIAVVMFFLLQARTAIVTFIVTLVAYCISKQFISKRMVIVVFVSILLSIVMLVWWHPKSVLGRIYIWIVSLNMLQDKPFGWGLYSFEKYYPEFQSQYTIGHPGIVEILNYDVVHSPYNEFLNIGVTLGIIAMLLYMVFVFYILILAYKKKSLLLFPLLAYQVISLSYFPFKIIPLTVLYIVSCTIVISDDVRSIHAPLSLKLRKNIIKYICIAVFSCFVISLYSYGFWRSAVKQSSSPPTYINACQSFEKSFPFLKTNGRFMISYAELQYKLGNKQAAFALMHQAESYFSDIAFLHNIAMIYEEEGDISTAKDKFNIVLNMSPNNTRILIAYIQFLQRIGEEREACLLKEILISRVYDE